MLLFICALDSWWVGNRWVGCTTQRHWARSICDVSTVQDFTVLHRHIRHMSYFFPEFSIWFWTKVDHRKSKKQAGKPWAGGVATVPTQVCLSAVLFGKKEHARPHSFSRGISMSSPRVWGNCGPLSFVPWAGLILYTTDRLLLASGAETGSLFPEGLGNMNTRPCASCGFYSVTFHPTRKTARGNIRTGHACYSKILFTETASLPSSALGE